MPQTARPLGILALAALATGAAPLSAATTAAPAGGPLELLIAPPGYLIANPARHVGLGYDGVSPYYDLVLQTVWLVNRGSEPLTLEGASVELSADGELLQRTAISPAEMARAQAKATTIAAVGFDTGLEILYSAGSVLPEGVAVSPSLTLAPGTAGLVDDIYLIVRSLPDALRVVATARTAAGQPIEGSVALPVREHRSPNEYILPVEPGEWFILAFPGLHGHHRWTAATEYALDITRVDHRGSWARGPLAAWRSGDVPRWQDWHAWGRDVLAAADGTVVEAVDDVEFPLARWNRRPDESLDAYGQRLESQQMELFQAPGADPVAVAGGNHVVIAHRGGEHTFYAHLAHGSIAVEPGQRVVRGQRIARIGGTGEMPAVHLHFQVSDGPSLLGSRSLPVTFANVEVNEMFARYFAPRLVFQPGFFVVASPLRAPPGAASRTP